MSSTPSESGLRAAGEAIGLTLTALVVSLVIGVAFIVPLVVLGYGIESTGVILGSTAASQVGFLAVAYGYIRWRGVPISLSVPTRREALIVGGGIVIALIAVTVLSAVLSALNLLPSSVIGEVAASDPTFLLGLAALSVLLVAPAEELLFRGAIQGRLRQRFGPFSAILGSSLLFGSMHLTNYSGALAPVVAGTLLIVVVGSILGTLYEYTDNLAVPILTHAVYNVILLLVAYVSM